MRRTPIFFIFSVLETARLYVLALALKPFASGAAAAGLFRLAAAPNAMLAFAFFFLGLDRRRFSAYKPLALVGKLMSVVSGALLIPSILSAFGGQPTSAIQPSFLLPLIAWDALSTIALALLKGPAEDRAPELPASPQPEPVETD